MRIDAQDIKGKKFSINLKEWQARIFQHEYDHLEVHTAMSCGNHVNIAMCSVCDFT